MRKYLRFIAIAAILTATCIPARSQSTWGDALKNIAQGVFAKSDLTLDDICGEWKADGSAVSFKSDNLLEKAGGLAAAGALENKINPYYEKLGLNNAVITINNDGTFSLKAKVTLTGTVECEGDGIFSFTFKAGNLLSLGTMKAYVQKSGNHMDLMFDATKLKNLISGIAKISGIKTIKAVASMLDSYEGLCVGFSLDKTSGASSKGNGNSNQKIDSIGTDIGGKLFDLLKSKQH